MNAKDQARLFALRAEGEAGAAAQAQPPPAGNDGAGEATGAEPTVDPVIAQKLSRLGRENQTMRRGRNDAAELLKAFGVEGENFDDVINNAKAALARKQEEAEKREATATGKPEDPRINMLLREVENLKTANKKKDEETAAVKTEARKQTQRARLHETLTLAGIPAEDIPVAASFIRDAETGNYREDEDGSLIWSPRDPKTGKPMDVPFDAESVLQFLPKKFLPAKGAGGSGGGAPRVAGPRGQVANEARLIIDGPGAQEAYEKLRVGKSEGEISGVQRKIQHIVTGEE